MSDVATVVRQLIDAFAQPDATALGVAGTVGTGVVDDGAPLGVRANTPVGELTITRQWDSESPNAATLGVPEGLQVADLEAAFGAARDLPARRPGDRIAMLGDNGPVVALDADGAVRSVTVRA